MLENTEGSVSHVDSETAVLEWSCGAVPQNKRFFLLIKVQILAEGISSRGTLMAACSLPLCPYSPPWSSALLIKLRVNSQGFPHSQAYFSHSWVLGMGEASGNALISGGSMEEVFMRSNIWFTQSAQSIVCFLVEKVRMTLFLYVSLFVNLPITVIYL